MIIIASLTFVFAIGAVGHSHFAMAADSKPVALAPMPKPTPQIGDTRTWKDSNGKKYSETIVGVDETTANFQTSYGCIATRAHHEFLAQYIEWKNCGRRRSNGRGTIKNLEGEIWPLTVGNKWKYDYEGSTDSGRSWSGRTSCEVTGQVRVSAPAGSFDTYRVLCETANVRREYHISPVIKINVLYKWEHKTRLSDGQRELVNYEPGKANGHPPMIEAGASRSVPTGRIVGIGLTRICPHLRLSGFRRDGRESLPHRAGQSFLHQSGLTRAGKSISSEERGMAVSSIRGGEKMERAIRFRAESAGPSSSLASIPRSAIPPALVGIDPRSSVASIASSSVAIDLSGRRELMKISIKLDKFTRFFDK